MGREYDSMGHTFITTNIGNQSYRIYYGQIKMNYPICSDRKQKGLTLREWCEIQDFDSDLLPLLYVILNVEPPYSGIMARAVEGHTYTRQTSKGQIRRMYGDAPLAAFQHQMIEKYGIDNSKNSVLDHEDCLQIFIENVFEQCKSVQTMDWIRLNQEDVIPEKYENILTKLFEYGGHRGCSMIDIMGRSNNSGTLSSQTPMNPKPTQITPEYVKKAPPVVQEVLERNLLKNFRTSTLFMEYNIK
jgi:hypothetical protein